MEVQVAATFAVEAHGIEPIPTRERWARARDVFGLVFGGANSVSTVVLGTYPVVFGLAFWDGVLAILLGVVIGSAILAPMVLFGPRNGTNNAVSSSGHFGVHGRLIGSLLGLLAAFTFLALAIWASSDALLGALGRGFGFEVGSWLSAVTYVLLALVLVVICVYGYRLLTLLNRFVPILVGLLLVVGIIAYVAQPEFRAAASAAPAADRWSDPLYVGGFFSSMLIAMSCPISYGPFLGDYSRYVAPTAKRAPLLIAVIGAQLACLGAFYFGDVTATFIAVRNPDTIASGDYVGGLLATAPTWFFIPLAFIGVAGGITTGTSLLYGTGLDFSSIVTRLSRVASTLLIGLVSVVFVLVGRFVFDMTSSVTTLSTLLVLSTVPWVVIMLIGLFTRRGWYDIDALQVFNRRQRGGRYWYLHGWNVSAVGSWLLATVGALLFVNLPGAFVGPLAGMMHGADISLFVGLGLAAILYTAALFAWPERRYLYGPDGPRFVPARSEGAPKPVLTPEKASV